MTTMMRVSLETREQVLRVAAEDFGGVTADEAVKRLLEEHWRAKAVAAMDHYRAVDPDGWAEFLVESEEWHRAEAPVGDPWNEQE
ncbi:hypothetical protein [Micromonospora sp. C95]|uniref:hypothetical protein n=1 Tax=Micromonospora sp. C95 TaxID=2824882 RepID=UPI001B396A2A|nr:hypothetical protein [Micromonospora sp. C95]MBQ1023251.1 hypothetical protein [Micromonospora sp. C95]